MNHTPLTGMSEGQSEQLLRLMAAGESATLEFKQARQALNKDVFESVCAFLNRKGGHLILGVKDNGEIQGIAPEFQAKIRQELVTGLNNPQLLSPPFALQPEIAVIQGKTLIVLYRAHRKTPSFRAGI